MEKVLVFIVIAGIPVLILVTSLLMERQGKQTWFFHAKPGEGRRDAPAFFRGYVASGTALFFLTLIVLLFKGCG